MTLRKFKEKIEKLEKAGLITDDFELETDSDGFHDTTIYSIEVDGETIILITD